jgi:hypothetical protein
VNEEVLPPADPGRPDSGEIRRVKGANPTQRIAPSQRLPAMPGAAQVDPRVILERVQVLEERLKTLPTLTQNTINATLEERLAALPRSISQAEVESSFHEQLAAVDLSEIIEGGVDTLVARVLETIYPHVESLITERVSKVPAAPGGPAAASAPASAPASDAPPSDAPASDEPPSDAPASDAPPSDAPPSDAPAGNLDDVKAIVEEARKETMAYVDARAAQTAGELIQGVTMAQKQLTTRVEEKITKTVSEQVAQFEELISQKTTDALTSFANSPAFKDILDKRFRVMLQHLEGDVIPRIVKKCLSPPND